MYIDTVAIGEKEGGRNGEDMYQLTISCFQNSQHRWLDFDYENPQIVDIGHNIQLCKLVCKIIVLSMNEEIPEP